MVPGALSAEWDKLRTTTVWNMGLYAANDPVNLIPHWE